MTKQHIESETQADMTNKTILLTGATRGIGYQLLNQLYGDNQLIVLGRNAEQLAQLNQQFTHIDSYQVDLADLTKVTQVAQQINDKYGKLDVLINNAAIQYHAHFDSPQFSPQQIEYEINTNFTAICYLIYYLQSSLQQSTNGIILNINSGLALAPKTGSAVYCATKAALNSLTQSLQYQFAGKNLKFLQAFLPLVNTDMSKGYGKHKLSDQQAAKAILNGLRKQQEINYIGKVKILALLLRICPAIAKRLLKGA